MSTNEEDERFYVLANDDGTSVVWDADRDQVALKGFDSPQAAREAAERMNLRAAR